MSAHTLGPWVAVHRPDRNTEVATVATCEDWRIGVPTPGVPGGNYRDINWGDAADDSRLIAAAPELLDALKSCEHEISACLREASVKANSEVLSALQTAYDEARKAIAKAGAA